MLGRNSSACVSKIIPCCKFQNTVYLFYILIFGNHERTLFGGCARSHAPAPASTARSSGQCRMYVRVVICLRCTRRGVLARRGTVRTNTPASGRARERARASPCVDQGSATSVVALRVGVTRHLLLTNVLNLRNTHTQNRTRQLGVTSAAGIALIFISKFTARDGR